MSVVNQGESSVSVPAEQQSAGVKPKISDILAGEKSSVIEQLSPFLPADLIGGSLPHVPGAEDESVWNAAAQACGSEKVHYTYTVDEGRVWYLACPSSSLASNPDSWCPLAAALPGESEHWDKETVYLYEQEGIASALRWDPETMRMQVYLGASRTILPRVQSMDANFVTINPKVADIKAWRSRSLHTEKLSRAMVRVLFFSGLAVNAIAVLILLLSLISMGFVQNDLDGVKDQTDKAALELMENAAGVMQSDTIKHMVRVQQLLDTLAPFNGYLVRYEVVGKRTEWDAIVPVSVSEQAKRETAFPERTSSGGVRLVVPKASMEEDDENVRLMGKK